MIETIVTNILGWIGSVVVALVVYHSLKIILKWTAARVPGRNHLISLIELIMLLMMGIVVLHEYLNPKVIETPQPQGGKTLLDRPGFLVILMVFFALMSLVLYIINRKTENQRGSE